MSDKKQVKLIMEVNKEDCDVVTTVTEKIVSSALGYTPMDAALKGANLGVSELDANGKVVTSQLPSFVDDVIEGYLYNGEFYEESAHTTKIIGETGKIYIDLPTEKTYRWSGSIYIVISETLALGETSSTAYRGDRGKIAYDHSQAAHAPSDAEKNQNAFANVKVGDITVAADNTSDTLTISAGDNVTITADAGTDTLTISAHDTTYSSAGSNLGLVKSGGDVTITGGVITVNDDSHNHIIGNVDGLKTALDGKAPSSHTHNYAGSSSAGGAATSANKLNTNAGSATQPVYFSNGVPVKTTYTLEKSVPSNAVFTDTWRGVQNNLTSTSSTDSLAAAQGKILNEKFSNYLPLDGGTMNSDANIVCHSSGDIHQMKYSSNSITIGGSTDKAGLSGFKFLNGTLDDGTITGFMGAVYEDGDIADYRIGPVGNPSLLFNASSGEARFSGTVKIGDSVKGIEMTQMNRGGFAMIGKYGSLDINLGASLDSGLTNLYAKNIYGSVRNEQSVIYSATDSTNITSATVSGLFSDNRLVIIYLTTASDAGDAFVVPLDRVQNEILLYYGNVGVVHFQYVDADTIHWFETKSSGTTKFLSVKIVRLY